MAREEGREEGRKEETEIRGREAPREGESAQFRHYSLRDPAVTETLTFGL